MDEEREANTTKKWGLDPRRTPPQNFRGTGVKNSEREMESNKKTLFSNLRWCFKIYKGLEKKRIKDKGDFFFLGIFKGIFLFKEILGVSRVNEYSIVSIFCHEII